jgi:zinc protease
MRTPTLKTSIGNMMRLTFCLMILAASLPATIPSAGAQATSWEQIPTPPLSTFHPPQPKRIQLSNGMVIFLQEDHELPLVSATARIRGGSSDEPAAKAGLVDIFGEVWRTGGTKTQTGDQLDDFLEVRAAKVEAGGGPDSTTISLSCLKGDFDDVFKVFDDLMRNPEFRADKIDLGQKQADDAIARRNDEIGSIAARESVKLAYGPDSPYAREPEYTTIDAITRQDLLDWYKSYIHPNNIILGVSGDFDSAAMESKLRAAFDSWPKGPAAKINEAKMQFHPAKPGYYLIPKNDVSQSSIHMVTLGTTRNNPDYYAISVFNDAFGGGFSSRLFNDIRTKRGLAYNVGGGIGTNFGHPGILQFVMGTKSQSTIESIQALDEDMDNVGKHPITEDEIKHAKDAILNAFIFHLDSPDKVLAERMIYEFYGYPADWLDKYPVEIQKVNAADVNRVAAKYVHRDQLAVLVVGNDKEFDEPLSSLGPVKQIDITIPPPPGAKQAEQEEQSAKPTASNAEGKALAMKVVAAMGGEAKLASIKSMKAEVTLTQKTPQGDLPMQMENIIVFPDRLRADMQTPDGTIRVVVTPDLAFIDLPNGQVQNWPEARKTETLEQIKRDPVFIASHAKDPNVFFHAAGTEKVGNVETRIVDVNAAGAAIRWFVDPQNGHIVKETYRTIGPRGPAQGETDMDAWKEIAGINIPTIRHNKQDGKDSSTAEYKALEVNPKIDPKVFEKPAEKSPAQP